jgi:hypothetical protein
MVLLERSYNENELTTHAFTAEEPTALINAFVGKGIVLSPAVRVLHPRRWTG